MPISDDSVVELVHEEAPATLGPVLAMTNNFTFEADPDPRKPGAGVAVDFVTGGSVLQKNAAAFNSGTMDTETRNVTVDRYSKGFGLTAAQLDNGHQLQKLLGKALHVVGTGARQVVNAPLTSANFGVALAKDAVDFGPGDLPTIFQAAKGFDSRHLLLEGDYYAKLIPTNADTINPELAGAYKMDSIQMSNEWGGAETGVNGFVGGSNALCIASASPVIPQAVENNMEQMVAIEFPGGLTCWFFVWADQNTFELRGSLQLMLGAAEGDTSAGKIITAAP